MHDLDIEYIRTIRNNMYAVDEIICDKSDDMEWARIHARKIRKKLAIELAKLLEEICKRES